MAKSFTELVEIIYFTPENAKFYETKNGFSALRAFVPPINKDDLAFAGEHPAHDDAPMHPMPQGGPPPMDGGPGAPPPMGGGGGRRVPIGSVYSEDGDTTPVWQDLGRVMFHKSFPFSMPEEYISVQDEDGREYGIIRKLSDFDGNGRDIIEKSLKRKYFCPEILKIKKVQEQLGYSCWLVDTDIGEQELVLRDTFGSITRVSDVYLVISDVSGNRYVIPNIEKLDAKSYKKIELYL